MDAYAEGLARLELHLLARIEEQLNRNVEIIMAAIDDLKAAVVSLSSAVEVAVADLNTAIASNDDTAVEAAAATLSTLAANLKTATDAFPPTPAPTPTTAGATAAGTVDPVTGQTTVAGPAATG